MAFGHEGADTERMHPLAAAEAHHVLGRLLDPRWAGDPDGLPTRPVVGLCRICGVRDRLTFEHIPPRAARNKLPAKGASAWDMLARGNAVDLPSSGWQNAQRGVGGHVLCERCNNHCGRNLVPEYALLVDQVLKIMSTAVSRTPAGDPGFPGTIDLSIPGFGLGLVARQAVAMLMASSGGTALTRLYPDLTRLLMGEPAAVPTDLRLGLALAVPHDVRLLLAAAGGARVRLAPPHAVGGPDGVAVLQEVADVPFRWTLSWRGTHLVAPERTTDVTDWLSFPVDEARDAQVTLPVRMIVSAVVGDTREEEAIRRDEAGGADLGT